MNDELQKLISLYEAVISCSGSEGERTTAANAFDEAIRQSAAKNPVDIRLLRNHVKGLYFEKARAEERRRGLPPPPHGI